MAFLKKYHLPLFFILIILITFGFTGKISLWDQDEAAYAGFAKTMIESGNWVIPDFMWSEIHRKPPLHFWNIAISYKIFGINEFATRFPSALFLILTYGIVFYFGRKFFGHKTALISAIILSTTLFIPLLAKTSVTDATLLFFSTLCAFSILQIIQGINTRFSVIIFWISFSLALLVKGPPILIFCFIFITLLFIFHPQRTTLYKLHPWFFLPIAISPFAYWIYLSIKMDHGVFASWMLDWYILKRINSSVLGQTGPIGTHLLLIIVFFIPYFMFLPKALYASIRGVFSKNNEGIILGAWFISGWLIYEFSPSKLPAYCVVAHVPLAIFIAKTISNYIDTNTKPHKGLLIVHFSFLLLIPIGAVIYSYIMELSADLKWSLIMLNALVFGGTYLSIKLINTKTFYYAILGINLAFQLIVSVLVLPNIDSHKNGTKKVAQFITAHAQPNSTIVLANKRGNPPSLPFYLGLTFTHIMDDDNLETILTLYNSNKPYVLVLNEDQKEVFLKSNSALKFHEVSFYPIDRKGKTTYYVLMNNESKQTNIR